MPCPRSTRVKLMGSPENARAPRLVQEPRGPAGDALLGLGLGLALAGGLGHDGALLVGAGLLGLGHRPALALAAVLALAVVVRALASALALAGVDAGTLHALGRGLRRCGLVAGVSRLGNEHRRDCRSHHRALPVLHLCLAPCVASPDGDGLPAGTRERRAPYSRSPAGASPIPLRFSHVAGFGATSATNVVNPGNRGMAWRVSQPLCFHRTRHGHGDCRTPTVHRRAASRVPGLLGILLGEAGVARQVVAGGTE